MPGFSENLINYLAKELRLSDDAREIAAYGLYVVTSTCSGLIFITIIAALLGIFFETIPAVLTVALLRTFAGGAHCSTVLRCSVLSGIVFPAIGLLAKAAAPFVAPKVYFFIVAVLVVSLFTVSLTAPVDSPEKPILTKGHKQRLKKLSIFVTLLINLCIVLLVKGQVVSTTVALSAGIGLLWQSFVLTKPAKYLMF